ncbi:MAG: sigma-70 family RNA polymerase sigma factor [Lachnospiraceae bacterium]|nr:sigma-70 family RNA polymerase sigma factor [Lachnospiraceae bacterium]
MVASIYEKKDTLLFDEVQKLINGNFESYEQVYELSKNYIYKIINDVVQNHHTTEDLMQETYLQVYRKINTLKEARAFYVWAGRIATNMSLRHIQKYRKEIPYAQVVDDAEEDSGTIFDKVEDDREEFIPETVLTNTEQQKIIAGILESLSPEQKLCVQYYYYEEMSVNDIAELMQCSTGTVKSRLNYARKSLKDAISTFEVKNDTKLYGLATLPVFFMVFKKLADAIVFSGVAAVGVGSAAVAGGMAMHNAAVGSGAVAGGGAATGGGVAGGGSAFAASSAATGGSAMVGGGTVAGGTAALGSSVATTAGSGFLATVVGKVAVVATAVCVTAGTAVASTEAAKVTMEREQGHVITYEEAAQQVLTSNGDVDVITGNEIINAMFEETESSQSNLEDVLGEDYTIEEENFYNSLNNISEAFSDFETALDYALTDEQYAYAGKSIVEVDNLMFDISVFNLDSQNISAGIEEMEKEAQEVFVTVYMPRYTEKYNEFAEIIRDVAAVYSKKEVQEAFAKYSAEDFEHALESELGSIGLISNDLSEETLQEIDEAAAALTLWWQDYGALVEDMAADPVFAEYFKQAEEEMSSMMEEAGY